jgi:hypothetical protein
MRDLEEQLRGLQFQECDDCASKPGSPRLCDACLHNRAIVEELKRHIRGQPERNVPDKPDHREVSDVEQFLSKHPGSTADEIYRQVSMFASQALNWMVLEGVIERVEGRPGTPVTYRLATPTEAARANAKKEA